MYAMFPVEWRFGEDPTDGCGGPAVEDAGTLFICRDEEDPEDWPNEDINTPVAARTTLSEMMDECLEGWRTQDGYTDDMHVPASKALAAALRAAADKLDAGLRPNAMYRDKTCSITSET